jgi:hypothetical protein
MPLCGRDKCFTFTCTIAHYAYHAGAVVPSAHNLLCVTKPWRRAFFPHDASLLWCHLVCISMDLPHHTDDESHSGLARCCDDDIIDRCVLQKFASAGPTRCAGRNVFGVRFVFSENNFCTKP